MNDLLTRVELVVSSVEAVTLYSNAGVPSGATMAPVRMNKIFVPTEAMSIAELAEVLSVYINVKLRGGALTPDEYEALPASVRKYFQDV